ncbi:MAG: hypothetical protein WBC74_03475 [Candidatus Omnitrophota bacterium]
MKKKLEELEDKILDILEDARLGKSSILSAEKITRFGGIPVLLLWIETNDTEQNIRKAVKALLKKDKIRFPPKIDQSALQEINAKLNRLTTASEEQLFHYVDNDPSFIFCVVAKAPEK